MRVLKRNNTYENVSLDQIINRIKYCAIGLNVDPIKVAIGAISALYDGIRTSEIDEVSAKVAANLQLDDYDYTKLAGRLCASDLQKTTPSKFSDAMALLAANTSMMDATFIEYVAQYSADLDEMIVNDRDMLFTYIGFESLRRSYLLKAQVLNGKFVKETMKDPKFKIIERPQYMYMRVAVATHINAEYLDNNARLMAIKQHYDLISRHYFTHATPTMFNMGTVNQQAISCFLLRSHDSIDGILKNLSDTCKISKLSGGIGVHMSCIRSAGSLIKSTMGTSKGLPVQLKMYDDGANAFDQGGNKRKGAFAVYVEPWHGDIIQILDMPLKNAPIEHKTHHLKFAMWVPQLFWDRMTSDGQWSLFSEDTAPGLSTTCGDEFNTLYTRYEQEGRALATYKAREIANRISKCIRECGFPYILNKDAANSKSNQRNLGVITGSNLCAEIIEYCTNDSYACCTLASVNVRAFYDSNSGTYDYQKLHSTVQFIVEYLDNIIDVNTYPVPEAFVNNVNYRPLGIGVQGLANLFASMRVPYLSQEAESVDRSIFETMYHAAMCKSISLAALRGPYSGYENSPAMGGELQFDMWRADLERNELWNRAKPQMYDWAELKAQIATHGLRNSLLIALMPTVSTSVILGNNDSFEPYTNNAYVKTTLSGKFLSVNEHMVRHFSELGLWNDDIVTSIIEHNGSVQHLTQLPQSVRDIYLTVFEMKQGALMCRQAIRGAYVCQSASNNIYLADNSDSRIQYAMVYGAKLGLKTSIYYCHTQPAAEPLKNGIRSELSKVQNSQNSQKSTSCSRDAAKRGLQCESCSG